MRAFYYNLITSLLHRCCGAFTLCFTLFFPYYIPITWLLHHVYIMSGRGLRWRAFDPFGIGVAGSVGLWCRHKSWPDIKSGYFPLGLGGCAFVFPGEVCVSWGSHKFGVWKGLAVFSVFLGVLGLFSLVKCVRLGGSAQIWAPSFSSDCSSVTEGLGVWFSG